MGAPPIDLIAPTIDEVATPAPGAGEETHTHQADALPRTVPVGAPSRVPLPSAPAGYEILGELGLGGMGAVYLAREVVPDRLVAMKFLRRPGSQTAYDRFLVEVRALAALDHPNIIRVITTDFFRSDPFFTTEYFPNGSLLKRVDEAGPLDPVEAAKIMASAARAVHAANQKDVIHRDLKPSNILLSADGVPKVADFGLAKRLNREDDLTTATGALGSPPYMAPEQTGQCAVEMVDARTDVYGLGATLYHLVTGRRPFVGDTPEQVIGRVLIDPPPRPRSVRPELPRELEAIILKCLEKDPSRRYRSGEALAADLDRFLAGRPPEAPLLTWPRRLGQRLRRNRRSVVSTLVGLAALTVIAWVWLNPWSDPVARYHRELRAGKQVTLVEATGVPRWYERPIGGVEVSADVAAQGACTVTAIESGTLMLLPSVPIDRYSVEAEFCELGVRGGAPIGLNHHQWCGLAVGYDTSPNLDGGRLHSFFAITFRDYDLALVVGRKGLKEKANCHAAVIAERPGLNPEDVVGDPLYRAEFVPSPRQPGAWRKVRFEVAPDRIRAYWRNDQGEMTLFADLDTDQIAERIAKVHETMNAYVPPIAGTIPEWSPRRGIALWCARSSFGVRNVIVTPEP